LLILITFISLFVLLYLDTQTRIIKIHVVNIRKLHVERFSQTGKSQDGWRRITTLVPAIAGKQILDIHKNKSKAKKQHTEPGTCVILYFCARYWDNSGDYGTIRTTRYYTWRNNLFLECALAGNFAVNNSTYITM